MPTESKISLVCGTMLSAAVIVALALAVAVKVTTLPDTEIVPLSGISFAAIPAHAKSEGPNSKLSKDHEVLMVEASRFSEKTKDIVSPVPQISFAVVSYNVAVCKRGPAKFCSVTVPERTPPSKTSLTPAPAPPVQVLPTWPVPTEQRAVLSAAPSSV